MTIAEGRPHADRGLRVARQAGRSSRPDAGSRRDWDACESALSHDRASSSARSVLISKDTR